MEFAPYRVSNALLTVGFMKALHIESMRAINVDMAGGILLDRQFWSDATAPRATAPAPPAMCE